MAETAADPPYAYPKPPEWDSLVEATASEINPNLPENEQVLALMAFWENSSRYDTEVIEDNRFYGLGLVACKVAKSSFRPISDPKSLANSVKEAIVGIHEPYCRDSKGKPRYTANQGLYLEELNAPLLDPVPEHIKAEYDTLSLAERITINALPMAHHDLTVLSSADLELLSFMVIDHHPALVGVTTSAYAASMGLTKGALGKLHQKKYGPIDNPDTFNPLIKDIATEDELRNLIPRQTAAHASSVRMDELAIVAQTLKLDDQYIARSDRSHIPRKPLPLDDANREIVRHEKRLKCPALRVGGAIAYAADTTPDIIIGVQRQLCE